MPSSTETFLCDRFTTEERGWGGWTGKKHGCPTPLRPNTRSPHSHLCIPHKQPPQTEAHVALWRKQNWISDLSPDDQIYSALQFPPCHPATIPPLEVTGRTDKGGGGWSDGRQWVKGRRSTFPPQSHEFPWTGQMLPHIFWLPWQVAYCFSW